MEYEAEAGGEDAWRPCSPTLSRPDRRWAQQCGQAVERHFAEWARAVSPGVLRGAIDDGAWSKAVLIAENALLIRQVAAKNRLWGAESEEPIG